MNGYDHSEEKEVDIYNIGEEVRNCPTNQEPSLVLEVDQEQEEEDLDPVTVIARDTHMNSLESNVIQAHWPFPSDHIMEGYTYILTHPGLPSVFYDHLYDWGDSIHDQIVKLIEIRKLQGIHSRSSINILEAQPNLYAANIGDNISMKIGDGSWCPGNEWILATSGQRYAVWTK